MQTFQNFTGHMHYFGSPIPLIAQRLSVWSRWNGFTSPGQVCNKLLCLLFNFYINVSGAENQPFCNLIAISTDAIIDI